jgi:hypothetical protein
MDLNTLYQHDNSLDVAFAPTKISVVDEGIQLLGVWYNITHHRPFILAQDNIFIKNEDVPKWKKRLLRLS